MIRPVWCILLGIAVLVPPSPAKAESAADLTVDLAQLATDRNAGALVEVRVADRDLVLSVDGQVDQSLVKGDAVRIKRNDRDVHFAHLPGYSYFAVLRQKLHWSGKSL